MLPPAVFDPIATDLKKRFRSMLEADECCNELPNLLDAEEAVAAFVLELGRQMVQIFVDVRRAQAEANRAECSCARRPPVHHRSSWTRKTLMGSVVVSDPYLYCRRCGMASRPVHAWLGTDPQTWSLPVEEAAVDLATDESCGKAVAKLARHHPGVEMGRTTALRLLHKHGASARKFIDKRLADARSVIGLPPAARVAVAEELEVEFDGGMIPVATLEAIEVAEGEEPELTAVRGLPKRRKVCRWEEVKAGLVQKPGEVTRLYSLRPTSGLEQAFMDLFDLACLKGWDDSTMVRGIADGARYIRSRMEDNFDVGNFQFILDRPHCKGHLSDAGKALESLGGLPAQEWATAALALLEQGHADDVVAELLAAHLQADSVDDHASSETLRLESGYFLNNRDAVEYAEYRKQGWSTASSEIESCHKSVVQARLKISGAWWHPDHVDDILALRMLKANGWWDDYWNQQRQQWRTRASEFTEGRRRPEAA